MNLIHNSSLVLTIRELSDVVSAGFDAAAGDPIGGCEVTPAGYAHMTHMLMPLAQGKLVLVLEVSPSHCQALIAGRLQSRINLEVRPRLRKSTNGRTTPTAGSLAPLRQRAHCPRNKQSHC